MKHQYNKIEIRIEKIHNSTDNEKSSSIAKKLFSEGRVHYLIDGDYSENSEADKLIKEFIISYKSK
jgi:hypothetical protein